MPLDLYLGSTLKWMFLEAQCVSSELKEIMELSEDFELQAR